MSEPVLHHYLSQVLIRQFIDDEENLYTFSKTTGYNEKKLHRSDFSIPDLNTTIDKFGNIDRYSIEKLLGKYFETDFPKHYNKIHEALGNGEFSKLSKSIKFIIKMGIIGDMRTREHQLEVQEWILGSLREIMKLATEEMQEEFLQFEKSQTGIKNKIPTDFKNTADRIYELMGEKIFSIFKAPENDFFFLPDCTSVVRRAQLEDDSIVNGEVLSNLSRQISTIIFPIDSKTIIVVEAAKICSQTKNGIFELSSECVDSYNKLFLKTARDKVICRDKQYLKQFIDRHCS